MHILEVIVYLLYFQIALETSARGHLDHPVAQEKKPRDKNLKIRVWLKFSLGKPVSHQILLRLTIYIHIKLGN